MKIDLLEEIQISIGSFAFVRIAGVENRLSIGRPRHAAAARGILHTGDPVGQMLSVFRPVKVQRAFFTAVFGKTNRDQFSIGRRHEPIHRHLSLRLDLIRIEHDFLRREIVRRCERNEQPLLLRRLKLQRKKSARTRHETAVRRRVLCIKRCELRLDLHTLRPRIEPGPRVFVLSIRPRLHRWRTRFLQPAIFVHDFDAVILVSDGFRYSLRSSGSDGHGDDKIGEKRQLHGRQI